jgi:YYY domain-containing protein
MSPETTLIFVLGWLAVLKLLQLALWPLLSRGFGDLGYPAAYPASVLLFTTTAWYFGLAHLPVHLALLPFVLLLGYHAATKQYTREALRHNLKWDAIFAICFVVLLEVRFINPSISFAEKFMDHAFLASIMRSPTIPPPDPWFAEGSLNVYYYLGHWMMGALGLASGVPSPVVFNLVLPTVLALAAVSLAATGYILCRRFFWLPVLTLFAVNPSFVVHALAGETMSTVMWESTRTITNTITEFPLFSMLWGDPHAHVIALFNQAFYLFVLAFAALSWTRLSGQGKMVVCACAALSLGSMPLINSWDVLIYAPITLLFGAYLWWQSRERGPADRSALAFLAGVPACAVALYLPYYLQLDSQGIGGIGIVASPSEPLAFLLVNGFFLLVFYAVCIGDMRERPYLTAVALPFLLTGYYAAAIAIVPLVYLLARRRFLVPEVFAILGLAILVLIEILYLQDNMGETYYRMNTVFKFSMVAWMMMGAAAFAFVGGWAERRNISLNQRTGMLRPAIAAAVLIILILPFALPDLSYGRAGMTLDGLAYLEEECPGDAAAIAFLRTLEGDITIVEAEGGDYSYYSRISSSTGIPTVIGMPFHEQMWRGSEGNVSERMADVRAIYEQPAMTVALMEKYGATHLYVGEAERERYDVSIPENALEMVYSAGGVEIYRLPPAEGGTA